MRTLGLSLFLLLSAAVLAPLLALMAYGASLVLAALVAV